MSDLLDIMKEPEWAAATGIPLFATLVGLAVTYVLVRRQLRSDRELRSADHRRDAVANLAVALVDAGHSITRYDADDSWWVQSRWPDETRTAKLVAEAEVVVGLDSLRPINYLIDSMSAAWLACFVGGSKRDPDMAFHVPAVQEVVRPLAEQMVNAGNVLRRWDGGKELGKVVASDTSLSPSRDQGAAQKAWLQRRRSAYDDAVDKLSGRHGLTLTKARGVTFSQVR